MSIRVPFLAYVHAFEIAHATGDWSPLESHFSADAAHHVAGQGPLALDDRGRDAVIAGLRRSVEVSDRRFDARLPEILDGPTLRADGGLWMHFRLLFRREALPDLEIEGEHVAWYENGRITRIDERLLAGGDVRVAEYLARHDAGLRRIAAPPTPLGDADAKRFRHRMMRSFASAYRCAVNQQDVAGALAVCTPDFTIDVTPLSIISHDREDTAVQLGAWFSAFPDCIRHLENQAVSGDQLAEWGRMTMTSTGPYRGRAPTGKQANLPVFAVYDFRGLELLRERVHVDCAAFCRALDFPLDRP